MKTRVIPGYSSERLVRVDFVATAAQHGASIRVLEPCDVPIPLPTGWYWYGSGDEYAAMFDPADRDRLEALFEATATNGHGMCRYTADIDGYTDSLLAIKYVAQKWERIADDLAHWLD